MLKYVVSCRGRDGRAVMAETRPSPLCRTCQRLRTSAICNSLDIHFEARVVWIHLNVNCYTEDCIASHSVSNKRLKRRKKQFLTPVCRGQVIEKRHNWVTGVMTSLPDISATLCDRRPHIPSQHAAVHK
ncbi:hypothetical protein J6590_034162 [Homalodisca vitripennis]|nr:hypothetical protein J6590_034161 [Homalodisca vitripennis]KAG8331774.1 hypothetical protein J6590_034162 [Homalodisca vitripennis]